MLLRIQPLLQKGTFSRREARALGVSSASLAYYAKTGRLRRLGHGVYGPLGASVRVDFKWQDLVEAVQRTQGIVCLTSALCLYDLTDEIPRQHWLAIANSTSRRVGREIKVVRMRNVELGRTMFRIGGASVPIFDRERTIVDAFRYLGRESAITALKRAIAAKGKQRVDTEKIRMYAKKLRIRVEPYLLALTT